MDNIDGNDLWRQIPPEEKLDLMSRSHATGIQSAAIGVIVGCTIAVGLHLPWLVWGSLLFAPLIFQFSAGRTWRGLRPRLMLEYLAVRSAGRRFAFSLHAKELTLTMVFRGMLSQELAQDEMQDIASTDKERTLAIPVWITLFTDAVAMLTEHTGGAEIKFGHLLNERLKIEASSPEGDGQYSNGYEVFLSYEDKKNVLRRFRLTSKHTAALIVFEKKIRAQIEEAVKKRQESQLQLPEVEEEPDISSMWNSPV